MSAEDIAFIASMGPRSDDRGNLNGGTAVADFETLQWGRDQMIAEIKPRRISRHSKDLLQWGRDQMIAEMEDETQWQKNRKSFNGAAIR